MKTIIKTFLLSIVFSYLSFSFVEWKLNPGEWNGFSRCLALVIYSFLLAPVYWVISLHVEEKNT